LTFASDEAVDVSLRIAEEPLGGAPNGAREARALPNPIQRVNDSLGMGLQEGAEACYGFADDEVLHLESALVGVERLAIVEKASDLVVGHNAVTAEDFSGPRDGLTTLGSAERL